MGNPWVPPGPLVDVKRWARGRYDAAARLAGARRKLARCRKAFEADANDVTFEHQRRARDAFGDAVAVAQEWSVANAPSIHEVC